jgi:DNA-binding MarR family transcriptional regulator
MAAPTLGFLLHDVSRLLRRRFEQLAGGTGLTRSQWQTIAFLSRSEGMSQVALAECLDIEPITLTRILDRLSDKGLIERRPDPADRRRWALYLTPAAVPILKEMESLGEATRSEALHGVAPRDLVVLEQTLNRMKANLWPTCHQINEKEAAHG